VFGHNNLGLAVLLWNQQTDENSKIHRNRLQCKTHFRIPNYKKVATPIVLLAVGLQVFTPPVMANAY
jgi:hypothetical protein